MIDQPIKTIKQVIKTDQGVMYTIVYDTDEPDPIYVPKHINRFKKWREKTAEKFWYKLHGMAEDHGACNGYWD
jgi:hypothetical protein